MPSVAPICPTCSQPLTFITLSEQYLCIPCRVAAENATRTVRRVSVAQAAWEAYEERAAIMEYDGGLPRDEAERVARDVFQHRGKASCPPG